MYPAELVTRENYLAVTEPASFKSDFDLGLYDPQKLDASEIERHVRSFFGEKLMKPRSEDLWIGSDGTLDPNYVEMMQKSINYWRERGDERAATRFEKELKGAENIVKLVILSAQNGDPLPVVMNASDPGDFYVDSEGRKKSVTFVWILESIKKNGWEYSVVSLPTKYIGLERHWELLKEVGDLQKTKNILKESLNYLTADNLIAYPVLLDNLIHSVEEIAKKLGFDSWDEIERIAADQLALDNDHFSEERRETMVGEFTRLIIEAVKANKAQEEKEALVDAMADMFALEAGGRDYLWLNAQEIRRVIDKNTRLSLAEKYKVFDKPLGHYSNLSVELGDLQELYAHRTWMINAFRTNPLAQEARATGCGGSGMALSQGFGMERFSLGYESTTYAGLDMMQSFGYQGTMTEPNNYSDSSSTGKYTEYYNYEPGTCTHCHEHKPYVAHPKSADVQCAGWCSDCET